MCILSGGHSYLESLVHGGRQQQMTEMRHRTPLHCVDWALVASQAHQKLPRYPCSADFVCKIRLYSRRHFWQNFPGLAPWDLLCWKLWVHCLYWSGKSLYGLTPGATVWCLFAVFDPSPTPCGMWGRVCTGEIFPWAERKLRGAVVSVKCFSCAATSVKYFPSQSKQLCGCEWGWGG